MKKIKTAKSRSQKSKDFSSRITSVIMMSLLVSVVIFFLISCVVLLQVIREWRANLVAYQTMQTV